jgi:hypothetical protein
MPEPLHWIIAPQARNSRRRPPASWLATLAIRHYATPLALKAAISWPRQRHRCQYIAWYYWCHFDISWCHWLLILTLRHWYWWLLRWLRHYFIIIDYYFHIVDDISWYYLDTPADITPLILLSHWHWAAIFIID